MCLLRIGHWNGSSSVSYLLISGSSGAEQLNLSHTVNLSALYFTCTFFRFSVHFHSRTDNRLLTYKSNFIVSIFITRNEFTDVIMKCLVVLSICIIFLFMYTHIIQFIFVLQITLPTCQTYQHGAQLKYTSQSYFYSSVHRLATSYLLELKPVTRVNVILLVPV